MRPATCGHRGSAWPLVGPAALERIIEDSGRWEMILDYELLDAGGDARQAFVHPVEDEGE